MKYTIIFYQLIFFCLLQNFSYRVIAGEAKVSRIKVYQLLYLEREPDIAPYKVRMLVSKRYLRIDDVGDKSGYILYDDKNRTIFSVSNYDDRILVIKPEDFSTRNLAVKSTVEYSAAAKAPKISGHKIYNYRLYVGSGKMKKTCANLQLAEGLLPDVSQMLKRYQQVISGQQVKLLNRTIKEMQTPCYLVDQVYNEGLYYDKGLPIQEWHSNKKSQWLINYKQIKVNPDVFSLPEGYSRFSVIPTKRKLDK